MNIRKSSITSYYSKHVPHSRVLQVIKVVLYCDKYNVDLVLKIPQLSK